MYEAVCCALGVLAFMYQASMGRAESDSIGLAPFEPPVNVLVFPLTWLESILQSSIEYISCSTMNTTLLS